jgi:hypothetical protein
MALIIAWTLEVITPKFRWSSVVAGERRLETDSDGPSFEFRDVEAPCYEEKCTYRRFKGGNLRLSFVLFVSPKRDFEVGHP